MFRRRMLAAPIHDYDVVFDRLSYARGFQQTLPIPSSLPTFWRSILENVCAQVWVVPDVCVLHELSLCALAIDFALSMLPKVWLMQDVLFRCELPIDDDDVQH